MKRLLPIFEWLPRYQRSDLRYDVIAGVTVSALVVPKALGYAGIALIPIQNGLYAAAAGALIYAIFGTSRQISTGPSSAIAAVAASAVVTTGLPADEAPQLVAAVTLMAGSTSSVISRVLDCSMASARGLASVTTATSGGWEPAAGAIHRYVVVPSAPGAVCSSNLAGTWMLQPSPDTVRASIWALAQCPKTGLGVSEGRIDSSRGGRSASLADPLQPASRAPTAIRVSAVPRGVRRVEPSMRRSLGAHVVMTSSLLRGP